MHKYLKTSTQHVRMSPAFNESSAFKHGNAVQIRNEIINEVRCYEAQIEESEKGRQPPGVEPRTPYIEDCEGWWLSGCRSSVAEHWRLKPEVSWVRLLAAAGLFHFPLFAPHNI